MFKDIIQSIKYFFLNVVRSIFQSGLHTWFATVVCALSLFLLIRIVYTGGIRLNLAAHWERSQIQETLTHNEWQAKDPHIVVILANDRDYIEFANEESEFNVGLRDLPLTYYREVFKKIADRSPRFLALNWLAAAHSTQEVEQTDFASLFASYPSLDVVLAYQARGTNPLPFREGEVPVVDADDCVNRVLSTCSYNPEWTQIIQHIASRWLDLSVLSINLPHYLPNYIAHVPRFSSLKTFSFHDILNAGPDDAVLKSIDRDTIVFIGTHIAQPEGFQSNRSLTQMTEVPHRDAQDRLVPYAGFWAQLTHLFVEKRYLRVMGPFWIHGLSFIIPLLFALSNIMLISRRRMLLSLTLALSLTLFLLFLNPYVLAPLGFYLPVTESLFLLFISFFVSSFFAFAWHSYRLRKVEEEEARFSDIKDLKENFLSLIGHNLNSPVAKLLSLMPFVDESAEKTSPSREAIDSLRTDTLKMQVLCQNALMSTLIEYKNSDHDNSVDLRDVWQRFCLDKQTHMQHLKIDPTSLAVQIHKEAKISYDSRIVTQAWTAMLWWVEEKFLGQYSCQSIEVFRQGAYLLTDLRFVDIHRMKPSATLPHDATQVSRDPWFLENIEHFFAVISKYFQDLSTTDMQSKDGPKEIFKLIHGEQGHMRLQLFLP